MDLASIIMAIHLSAPKLSEAAAESYGKIIYQQANKLEQDPLLIIAIIKHESRWNSSRISKDGLDYGLMQVRARYYGGPAVNLLNPWINIVAGSYIMESSFEFCEKHLGRKPLTQEYLSCYAGSCGKIKTRCQPTKITNRFEKYAACLGSSLNQKMCIDNCDQIYLEGIKL